MNADATFDVEVESFKNLGAARTCANVVSLKILN